jgi:hypothetical protein
MKPSMTVPSLHTHYMHYIGYITKGELHTGMKELVLIYYKKLIQLQILNSVERDVRIIAILSLFNVAF